MQNKGANKMTKEKNCTGCWNIANVWVNGERKLACRDGGVLTEHDLTVERPVSCVVAERERRALREALRL
jgi:hypothetical protein